MTSALAALPRAIARRGLPRAPLRLIVVAAVLAVAGGAGWMWARDSSLVRVKDVFITGVSVGDAAQIRGALRSAAEGMTTLNVREEQLRAAVSRFPSVADLKVQTDFPSTMTIEVVEHVPVAAAEIDGRLTAISSGGLVMQGIEVASELPKIKLGRGGVGERVVDRKALAALGVLGAAPAVLRPRLEQALYDERGLVILTRSGPELIFGDSERARAKWLAAARVLADPGAIGAVYLDLRIPERVAAGGVGQSALEAAATPTPIPSEGVAAPAVTPVPTPVATATPVVTPAPTQAPPEAAAGGASAPATNSQP